jgi:asparagine synthase (glutamine-hydrolysing)
LLPGDERPGIEELCAREGLVCTFSSLAPSDVIATILADRQPVTGTRFYCEPLVRQAAAAQGVRTLLSGWGGDETAGFNGRGYLAELLREGRWLRLGRELRALVAAQPGCFPGLLRQELVIPLLPDRLLSLARQSLAPGEQSFLRRASWSLSREERQILHRKWQQTRVRPGGREVQRRLLAYGHLALRTEAWAIRGAAAGIEYRYPLLDLRLVNFCLRLPPELHLQQGWRRFLFRHLLDPVLPPGICWNPGKAEPAKATYTGAVIEDGKRQLRCLIAAGALPPGAVPLLEPWELPEIVAGGSRRIV